MRVPGRRLIALLAAAASLVGCDTAYDETLIGPYRLHAIDTMESMSIVWEIPGGGLVGDGLPGPTVFAAGHDDRYLVAAVHPQHCPPFAQGCTRHGMNRDVIEYWYVIRRADERQRIPYAGIKGPFDAAQFEAERRRLRLPPFSIHFQELQ